MLAADPGFLPAVWLDKDDVRPRSVVAEPIRPYINNRLNLWSG